MKIAVVHVNAEKYSGLYTELIDANFRRARADATRIEHRYVRHLRRATDTVFAYPTLLNKVDVVEEVLAAASEGADAVMVACSGDPGVAEARTLVSIPVVADGGRAAPGLHPRLQARHRHGCRPLLGRVLRDARGCLRLVRAAGRHPVDPHSVVGGLHGRILRARPDRRRSGGAGEGAGRRWRQLDRDRQCRPQRDVQRGRAGVRAGHAGADLRLPDRGPEDGRAALRAASQDERAPYSRAGWGGRLDDGDTARLRKLFRIAEAG